ncbi:MAG: trigger factor [Candidatus Kapaibacteriota bacterium]|jgi:trigger factor
MEVSINKIDDATRELIIVVPKAEYDEGLEKEFKTAQNYISLKGFRKGRVPLNLIKNLYGKQIEEDFVGEFATKIFKDASEKNEIKFVGKPIFKKYTKEDDKVTFVFTIDVVPDFELKEYKGLKIYEPIHRVSDEEIDHEIEHRRLYSANVTQTDKIENENTLVTIDIVSLDQSTLEEINEKTQTTTILLSSETVPQDLKQLLLGRNVGDEFIYNPHDNEPSAPNEQVKIKIKNISELVMEEFNDEFVQKYTQGRLQTTEEFREEIGYFLQEKWDMKTNDEMVKQVIKQLVDAHSFDLPQTVLYETAYKLSEDFLKKYAESYPQLQGKKPDELLEDFIPIAESQVKWAIIKKKIIEKENIQIEDYDIDSIVEEHKRQNPNTSEEELRNYIKNTPHIVDTLLEKKVLDFIIGFAETTEIDFDEYMKMLEGQTTEENSLEPEETLVDSVENTNIKDQNQDTELKENR